MPFVYEHPEYWKKVLDMILSTQNTIAMERKLMVIIYEYGNPDADNVLIQLTGDHELSGLENEVEEIRKRTSIDFRFIAAKVDDWNYELSPWKAPAVFGNEDFGDGAARTLEQILTLCTDKSKDILYRRIFSCGFIFIMGSISDRYIFRRCSGFAICLVSGIY